MSRLKALFKPLQPSIDHGGYSGVSYQEVQSHEKLSDYIHCYWQLQTTTPLSSPFMYRVVSDGCIDILFETLNQGDIYVTGFSTQFLEYNLGQQFNYLGIRFLPTGFPALFDISADMLTDSFKPLSEVVPQLSDRIKDQQSIACTLEASKAVFDSILLTYLPDIQPVDSRLIAAMDTMLEARGNINLGDLDVGVSERQLRRLFGFYFGESPKVFAKVIRFQNILNAKPSVSSLRENKLFFDEGYYDQAHFIKEFKAFYGVTPSRAFGR